MSDQSVAPPADPISNDPDAPVIYADMLLGGGVSQGNLSLTFGVRQFDHALNPPTATRRVCLRLVLPGGASADLAQFVTQLIQRQQPLTGTAD